VSYLLRRGLEATNLHEAAKKGVEAREEDVQEEQFLAVWAKDFALGCRKVTCVMEGNDVYVDEEGYEKGYASRLCGDDDGDNFVVHPFQRCYPGLE
jgi:hypothetical protein